MLARNEAWNASLLAHLYLWLRNRETAVMPPHGKRDARWLVICLATTVAAFAFLALLPHVMAQVTGR